MSTYFLHTVVIRSPLGRNASQAHGFPAPLPARDHGGVVGICGGLQMMGVRLDDPDGAEGDAGGWSGGSLPGLGLLPLETRFLPGKPTRQVVGRVVAPLASREEPG